MGSQSSLLGGINYGAGTQALSPYVSGALGMSGVSAASPYLSQAASQTLAGAGPTTNVSAYMNPYEQSVMGRLAQQAGRNLEENIMPGISDAFVKAGQFGGTRMGEFGSRAIRDTQEALLQQQAGVMQQGYSQAQQAAQADAARRIQAGSQLGQLGGQLGQLTQAQQQAILQSGQALSATEQQELAQRLAGASQLGQIGGQLGQLTQAQQQAIMQGGQALSSAEQQALAQRLAGASQYGQMGQMAGQLTQAQQQALMSAGTQMGGFTQAQQQALAQIGQQLGGLRTSDVGQTQSILQQLAAQAQMGQQMGYTDLAALEAAGATQRANQQQGLTAAYNMWQQQQAYPQEQLNWLSSQIRGMQPYSTLMSPTSQMTTTSGNTGPSPLSQLASGFSLYKGLTS